MKHNLSRIKVLLLILVLFALPSSVYAKTYFQSKSASGHLPSSANTPSTFYQCHLGGHSERVISGTAYGSEIRPVSVSMYAQISPLNGSGYTRGDSCTGILGVDASVSLYDDEMAAGWQIILAGSTHKVGVNLVALLFVP